jgi:NAD(P)-dependent dehydrogenase (short-subunit alcohol dehydrogenase family)
MSALSGRRCLVTGAASGIGRAIARAFADSGAVIAGVDCDAAGMTGLPVQPVVEDLATDGGAIRALAAAEAAIGSIEVLVNAAGISRIRPAERFDPEEAGRILAVNLLAPMALCAGVLPGMRAARGGCIVNIISELALVAQPGFSAYCASKGGLLAYARALALECAPLGIRVNSVCPGPIDTPMLQREFTHATDPVAERAAAVATVPIGRLGRPEEIAEIAVFLATAPALMQGAVLIADGGKTLQ